MRREQCLTRGQYIRMSPDDYREIENTAVRLGLTASEITRRSIRIELPILRDLNIPGAQNDKRRD